MRIPGIVLLFACLGAFGAAATEYRKDAECPVFARLSVYIAGVSSLERGDECPTIIFSSNARAAQGPVQDRAALRNIGSDFYPQTGAILISPFLDTNSVTGRAILLHQLVHARQYAQGMDRGLPCRALLEAQAFAIQAQYLEDNGYGPEAEATRQTGVIRARCSEDPDHLN